MACLNIPYNYSNSKFEGIISYSTANTLFKIYGADDAKSLITAHSGNIPNRPLIRQRDTRSVWFSLDRLKNFIWHIGNQNCVKGCNDSLGLRIYFAKYPDFKNPTQTNFLDLIGVPERYSYHHTLFMIPTYKNEDHVNVDFDPGGKSCRLPFFKSVDPSSPQGSHAGPVPNIRTPYIFTMSLEDAQNHGGLIPPDDGTGSMQ